MFDTLPAQIGAVLMVLVGSFAILKGDQPERTGACLYLLGWFASLLTQGDGRLYDAQKAMFAIDIVMVGVFAALAWKSRRTWPVWACALQLLVVMSHVLTIVDMRPPIASFYAVMNLASLGILASLAIGTFWAWQERRAAGLQ